MSYNTTNYNEQGGEKRVIGGELEVTSGGKINVVDGAELNVNDTDLVVSTGDIQLTGGELNLTNAQITNEGVQASAIADHADTSAATTEEVATKQNEILAALRGVGIIAE